MQAGTIVKHTKGGVYLVIGEATHTETQEPFTIYMGENGRIWCRPKADFEDGRFTPLAFDHCDSLEEAFENYRRTLYGYSVKRDY